MKIQLGILGNNGQIEYKEIEAERLKIESGVSGNLTLYQPGNNNNHVVVSTEHGVLLIEPRAANSVFIGSKYL